MLRRVLSECFECSRQCLGNWECQGVLPRVLFRWERGKTLLGALPGQLKGTLASTPGALSGSPQKALRKHSPEHITEQELNARCASCTNSPHMTHDMSHDLVRTSPFYTSPFCRIPAQAKLKTCILKTQRMKRSKPYFPAQTELNFRNLCIRVMKASLASRAPDP